MNLTDSEIKKAMECCGNGLCTDCPRLATPYPILSCKEQLIKSALDLNNRQQAEIERLNGLLAEWKTEAYKLSDSIDNIKIEAINVELTEDMINALKNQKIINIPNANTVNVCFVSNEWISVKERLPEEDTRVLVYLDINKSDAHTYTFCDTDRLLNGKWVRWNKYVTHWMPLPEPPKEGDTE